MDRVRPAMLIAALVVDVARRLPRRCGSGHKAGQSRSLTEHIIEDHAEFWCLCLAIPRVYISDSVDEWYDEDTHEPE